MGYHCFTSMLKLKEEKSLMSEKLGNIDSGILQFVPKGAYYEEKNEQYESVKEKWLQLLDYDRTLFCLIMLLKGSGFSKGAMSHILLSNSNKNVDNLPAIKDGLPEQFEKEIIIYNLNRERPPRALKNLLMLTGTEGHKKVNNSRTRKIILEFIFNRNNISLDNLAVNYKGKLQTLIKHALGKQDLAKLINGDSGGFVFRKFIGRYNSSAFPVICHIFNKEIPSRGHYFPMIEKYYLLKDSALNKNVDEFRIHMDGMPERTVMGMRNLYKVDIPLSELKDKTQRSEKDKIQGQQAAKRAGIKININYKKQDIYDLFKFLYFKLKNNDEEDVDKIIEGINHVEGHLDKIDMGECVVIMDASHSMYGSDERPMHPFLTGLSIIANLKNIKDIIYVGGKISKFKSSEFPVIIPKNNTNLWKGLIEAVSKKVENIIVISDGYENTIKGMFNHVYKYLKESEYNFKLTHINPVFSAGSSNGTTVRIADDVKPFPVGDYKYLETEVIFSKLVEDRDMVRKLLISKYKNLIK